MNEITKLIEAVKRNDKTAYQKLYKYGITALCAGVMTQELSRVQSLIKSGARVDVPNRDKTTPLHEAVKLGNKDIIALLIVEGADVNAQDSNGITPLNLGSKAIAQSLIAHYAKDVNRKILLTTSNIDKTTLLYEAIKFGNEATIALLVKHGADVNAQDIDGRTPIHLAAEFGSEAIVKSLIAISADVNAQDIDGKTPVHYAAIRGNSIILESLLKSGSDPDTVDSWGNTPLHFAKEKGHKEIISMLEQAVAQKNESDDKPTRNSTPKP